MTAAQGALIVASTNAATVDFSAAGVSDAFGNLVDGDGTTSDDFDATVAKDGDINVSVTGAIADASAQDVTDLNALMNATTGSVTATIDGNAAELDGLQATGTSSSTQALTITVDDAQTGAAGVTALNTVAAATTGTVTATISGNAADLDDLAASGATATQAYTITVDDAVTAAQGALIVASTNAATVDFSAAGVSDAFGNLVDGDGTTSDDFDATVAKDGDINVSVTGAIADASAQDVTDLNALMNATTGTVTATIDGNAAELDGLQATGTSSSTQALTITVDDAVTAAQGALIVASTNAATVDFSAAGVSDAFGNLVDGDGTTSDDFDATVAKDGDINVSVTGAIADASAQDVTDLNALMNATTGTVTATIDGNAAELDGLQATGTSSSTQALTITVDDAVTAAQGALIVASTNAATVDFSAAGVSDAFGNLVDGDGTTSDDFDATVAKDGDINVSVTGAIADASAQDVTDLNALMNATTGTVTATIDGNAAELDGLQATGTSSSTQALTITVDDAVTAAQGALIVASTNAATVDFSAAGVSDAFGNLVDGDGTTSDDFDATVAKDGDINVSVTGAIADASAQDVTDLNALMNATTGTVTATIDGNAAELDGLQATGTSSSTQALTITVDDAVTAAQGALIVASTNAATVDFSAAGVSDAFGNLVDGDGTTSDDFDATVAKDGDINVSVTGAIADASAQDVTDLNALMNATTGTVTATIDGNAAELDGLQATGTSSSTQALTITVDDAVTAAQGALIVASTNAATVDFSAAGVSDAFGNLVDGDGTTSDDFDATVAKDGDINVSVTGAIADASAQDVTDLNALMNATTGSVTATIDGNAAELDGLQATGTSSSTQALTITVDDAQTGAAGVTALNTVAAATTGTVTATISGNAADLDDLAASGATATQAYTITVDDAVTAAQGALIVASTNAATVDFSAAGVSDAFGNLVDGDGTTSDDFDATVAKDGDINVSVTGAIADASAQDVTDLNALMNATTGSVTATIDGNAAELDGLQATGTSSSTQALTITVDDAVTAAQGALIVASTNAATVDFSAAGVSDAFGNLVDGDGTTSDDFDATVAKDGDINVSVTGAIADASAQDVTDLNALMNATTGTVTATIDGNAAELDGLQATGTSSSTQALTITVDDAVTAAQGALIVASTNAATVDFSAAGVSDAFGNLVDGDGTTSDDFDATVAKDGDINVSVTGAIADASAQDVTDLNALMNATTGTVTATIDGNAAELDGLQATGTSSSTQALTITVDDAQTGAAGVTALNTVAAATTGTVTATISGNAADLDDLAASGATATQAYTITVDDAVTAAQGALIVASTNAATVDFSAAGVSDAFGNLVDGDGTTSDDFDATVAKDGDINVSVTGAIADASAQDVTDLNALMNATTGSVTATIDGNAAELDGLQATGTSSSTQALTITVDDAVTAAQGALIVASTNAATVDFSAAGVSDAFGNLVDGDGTTSDDFDATVAKDGDINVSVTGAIADVSAQDVTDLNALMNATTGTVTATIDGNAAELDGLQATGTSSSTQALTITVDDAVTAAQGALIVASTNAATVDFSAAGVSDAFGNLVDGDGTTSDDFDATVAKDGDINVSVTGAIADASAQDVTDLNALMNATTGTVTATIDGNAAELDGLQATGTSSSTQALTITVDDAVTAAQGALIVASTNAATVDFSAAGVSDAFGNLVDGDGTTSDDFDATVAKDGDINVSVTGAIADASAQDVTDLNALMNATTGSVTATIDGNAAELDGLQATGTSSSTQALTITVDDAVTAAQGALIVASTNAATVDFSAAGVSDAFGNLVDGDGTTSDDFDATVAKDGDINVSVTGAIADVSAQDVTDLNALMNATTGTVTATIDGNAAELDGLQATGTSSSTQALTITVDDAVTAAQGALIVASTNAATVDFSAAGVSDAFGNLVDGDGTTSDDFDATVAKDGDINVSVTGAIADASAQDVTDLNALMNATTGTVTATIDGNAAELDGLQATGTSSSTQALTITVDDAVTAAQGALIVASTNAATVDFSAAGVSDAFGNLVDGDGTTSDDFDATVAKDGDINVSVTGAIADASAQDVTDLNALMNATTGSVTATIDGNAAELDGLQATGTSSSTQALTITVDDAQTGAAGVTALNTVAAATTGTVTATISGNAADLDDLAASGATATQAYTITVDDAVTAAQGALIVAATNAATVDFTVGGVIDITSNLAVSGSVTSALSSIVSKDGDVAITISDAVGADVNAADLSAIGGSTTATVTLTNAVNITGTVADINAALVTAETKVILVGDSNVTVRDVDETSDLSGVNPSGGVTALIEADRDITANVNLGNVDTYTVSSGFTLTALASQMTGLTVNGAGTGNIAVTALHLTPAADLSGLSSVSGTVTAAFDGNGTFTGTLGGAVVTVGDGFTMTAAANVVAGQEINQDSTGVLAVTIGTADVDVNLTTIAGSALSSVTVTEDVVFTGTLFRFLPTIIYQNATLEIAASKITGLTINGDGALIVKALAANTNLENVNPGGGVTAHIEANRDITANAKLGNVDTYVVSSGFTLTATGAQLNGKTVSGDGIVIVTGVTAEHNLDNINPSGGVTITSADGSDLTGGGDLSTTVTYTIPSGFSMTAGADQLDGVAVVGEGTLIVINTATGALDLSKLTVGVVDVTGADLSNAAVTWMIVAAGDELRLTSGQATGQTILAAENASAVITVSGLAGDANLTNIGNATATVNATVTGSIDITGNGNLGRVDTYTVSSEQTLTASADQVDGIVVDGGGSLTVNGTATGATDLSSLSAYVVDITGADLTSSSVTWMTVAAGDELRLTSGQATGQTILAAENASAVITVSGLAGDANLTNIGNATATVNATVTSSIDITSNGNLGNVDAYTVSSSQTLTALASQVVGKVVNGEGALTVNGTATGATDLSSLSADVVDITGADLTNGSVTWMTVAAGDELRLTSGQATGQTILAAENASAVITVSGLAGDANLTTIGNDTATVNATVTGSIDITGNVHLGKVDTYTVSSGFTLTALASQVNGLTVVAAGTGNIAVTALHATPAANLSGLTSASGTVTAAFDASGTFTGNLGTAVVTVADSAVMTAAYNVLNGKTIIHDGSQDNQGLVVTIGAADAAAVLSTITSDITNFTARFTQTQSFTGDLDGKTAAVADAVTVTATAAVLSGETVVAAGTGNIAVTALHATPAANLSGLTSASGTVTAAFDASGTFTGNLGTAVVTVADSAIMTAAYNVLNGKTINHDGSQDNQGLVVTIGAADAAAVLSTITSDITNFTARFTQTQSFTGDLAAKTAAVADGVTVTATAAVLDGETVAAAGTGNIAVTALHATPAANLSGLSSASGTVTAAFDATGTFTGNLGTAVVTVADGAVMTAAYDVLNGKTINHDGSENSQGLVVTIAAAEAAADLNNITSDIRDFTARFTQTQSFTGDLAAKTAAVADGVTVTATAAVLDGETAAAAGNGNIAVTALHSTLAANLSGLSSASGTVTAAFDATGTFTGNLGTAVVTVADGAVMTAAAIDVAGKTINKINSGALTVTVRTADANVDLTSIAGDAINSVTVKEDLTFTGTLDETVSTSIDTSVTLTIAASKVSGKAVTGTGSLIIEALAADTDLANVNPGGGVTARVGADLDITDNAFLGDVDIYEVSSGSTLRATGAQLNGKTVLGDGSLIVERLVGGTDLTNVNPGGGVTALVADNISITGNGTLGVVDTYTVSTNRTLTATADQVDGIAVTGEGRLTVNGTATGATDLSSLSADVVDITGADLTNGSVTWMTVAAGDELKLTSGQTTGQTILSAENALAVITVSGLAGDTNLTNIGNATATVNATVTSSIDITGNVHLGNVDKYTVSSGQTLVATADQVDGIAVDGEGRLTVNGTATGATGLSSLRADVVDITGADLTNGSVTWMTVGTGDELRLTSAQANGQSIGAASKATAVITVSDLTGSTDLSGIANATATVNATVTGSIDITGNVHLGKVDTYTVSSGFTLTALASQVTGLTVSGAGSLIVEALAAGTNLAKVNVGGGVTALVEDDISITGNGTLGVVDTYTVSTNRTLTATADQVDGIAVDGDGRLTVNGTATGATDLSSLSADVVDITGADLTNGSVTWMTVAAGDELRLTSGQVTGQTILAAADASAVITVLDLAASANLADIGNNTATVNAVVTGSIDISGNPSFGNVDSYTVSAGFLLTATAAQMTGRIVTGDGAVKIIGVDGTTDLTGVNPVGGVTAVVLDGIDISGNTTLGNVDYFILTSANEVTMTIDQHNKIAPDGASSTTLYNEVTLSEAGEILGNSLVRMYNLSFEAGVTNIFTTSNVGQTVIGSTGADEIYGGVGNDILSGGAGSDVLNGGSGNDVLTGGAGFDSHTGRSGIDTFVFSLNSTPNIVDPIEIILDFTTGEDKIDVGKDLGLGASRISIVDGVSFELDTFKAAATSFFDGNEIDVFVAYNVANLGDALMAIDHNANGTFDDGDTFVKLIGINEGAEILTSDFAVY